MAPWLPLGIGMKSMDPLSDPTLVQWVLGSSWCTASCGESMQAVPGGWRNWYHWMAPTLVWPKSNRTPLGHYVSVHPMHLRLSRSSVMPWSRSGRKYSRTASVVSLGACPDVVRQHTSTWGTPYWVPFWVAAIKFSATWTIVCCIIFSLWFLGCL